jgi:predicted nuclease of predicted toxin-antitoxin system
MIICDENIDQHIIYELRHKNYSIYSIREKKPGISDQEIIKILRKTGSILITEDKDFGEFVFSYHMRDVKIIFLRYYKTETSKLQTNLENILEKYLNKEGNYFITITPWKIRISIL